MTLPQASLFIVSFRERKKRETSIKENYSRIEYMPPMFPNDATEEDRYRGVTIDSSKFGTEEVITTEKFESILHKVRVIKL